MTYFAAACAERADGTWPIAAIVIAGIAGLVAAVWIAARPMQGATITWEGEGEPPQAMLDVIRRAQNGANL